MSQIDIGIFWMNLFISSFNLQLTLCWFQANLTLGEIKI